MLSGGFNMAVQQGPLPLTEADRIFDLFDTDHAAGMHDVSRFCPWGGQSDNCLFSPLKMK